MTGLPTMMMMTAGHDGDDDDVDNDDDDVDDDVDSYDVVFTEGLP